MRIKTLTIYAAAFAVTLASAPNIDKAQAEEPLIIRPEHRFGDLFGQVGGSFSDGDLDRPFQDIDIFQRDFKASLGYRLSDRFNLQLDWNQSATRYKFNNGNATAFDSSIFGGKLYYREYDHFELGAGYSFGETDISNFTGDFEVFNLFGSIYWTPYLTSYGSIGRINGSDFFQNTDGDYIEGGLKYYFNPGLGNDGFDVSIGLNAGRIFLDDFSKDAKSLRGYFDYKPHADMPITLGTSLNYTKFDKTDSLSVTGRLNFHFGRGTWTDTRLVDLDRNSTTMAVPDIVLDYYRAEF